MTDFDLLSDPWIQVVTLDGANEGVDLLACLRRAHTLREIADQSPLVTFALHRFLAAVLQAYLPLPDLDGWWGMWKQGQFDEDLLGRVQLGCEGRLRLFDPERPFYQAPNVPLRPPKASDKTVGYLQLEESTGTNVTHFSHAGDAAHALCPACCARGLVTLVPFALAGGAGIRPSINGVPPFYVLPRGSTLFRTLLLNYVVPGFQPSLATQPDPGPLWARDQEIGAQERSGVGFVESLTWPPRQVRLFPGAGGTCSACAQAAPALVRKMHFQQGWYRGRDAPVWDDPCGVYAMRPEGGQKVRQQRRPRDGRDVWRDFPALFLTRHDAEDEGGRPAVVRQIARATEDGLLDPSHPVHLDVVGLRTDMKAKVFEWRADTFELPPSLLQTGPAGTIERGLAAAEEVAKLLVYALRELHPESDRDKKDRSRIAAATAAHTGLWERRYWLDLERIFREMLTDRRLAGFGVDRSGWSVDWEAHVHRTGGRALDQALDAAESDADGLRRQVAARRAFYGGLKKIFAPTNEGGTA